MSMYKFEIYDDNTVEEMSLLIGLQQECLG